MGNAYYAILWLPVRFFVGREWLAAGEEKLRSDAWMNGGVALKGFWAGAVAVPDKGRPAITYGWFRTFLDYMLRHQWYTWFAKVIAIGETLVGIGLGVGALVGIAAFFGTLMNFNFQLAGSASTNSVLFVLGVFLVLAWKVAGWWGWTAGFCRRSAPRGRTGGRSATRPRRQRRAGPASPPPDPLRAVTDGQGSGTG